MYKIQWNNKTMATGIEILDAQHKELLSIINELVDAVKVKAQQENILTILTKISDNIHSHFDTEERLFDTSNYPEKESHTHGHDHFKEKLTKICDDFSNADPTSNNIIEIAEDIYMYLSEWFIDHVLKDDQEYVEYLK